VAVAVAVKGSWLFMKVFGNVAGNASILNLKKIKTQIN